MAHIDSKVMLGQLSHGCLAINIYRRGSPDQVQYFYALSLKCNLIYHHRCDILVTLHKTLLLKRYFMQCTKTSQ
jgi:hypothetical protein